MTKVDKQFPRPPHDVIAACAQIIYEMEGRPTGRALDHWLLAESLLIADSEEWQRRPAVQSAGKTPEMRNGSKRKRPSSAASGPPV